MSQKTRTQLKAYYETNDVPTQAQYADLVDSVPNLTDDNYVLPTFAVGTTTTLSPGEDATVVNSGTGSAAVLDFGIPEGEKGETGSQGIQGVQGIQGDKGDKGDQGDQGIQGIQGVAGTNGTNGTNGTDGEDGISFIWEDAYVAETTYQVNDVVSYNGSSYICILESTGNLPTNVTYWSLMAQKGTDGAGSGDISGSGVANELAYFTAEKTIDNLPVATYPSLTEVSYVKGVTSAIQTQLNGKEVTSNKENTTLDTSTTKYPTNRLAKEYADGKVEDSITDGHTTIAPSGNAVFDALAGKQDALAFTPEDSANKETSALDTSTTKYPCNNVVKEAVDAKLALAGGTMTGDIQLGETDIKLDATLSADEKWSGITVAGTAGATLAVGDVCYLATSGKWLLNDGILDGTDTGFDKQLGVCVLAGADTEPTEMLLYGKIRSAAFPAFTVGSPVYLSDTAGDLVVAQPSTTNFAIRKVGIALSAEELMFNPSNDYIVHI